MMNLATSIPDFFVKPRNTVIQILFTTVFTYAFILIYHPFGSQNWFEVNEGQFAFYTGFVVVVGMLVVIASRVIMTQIRRKFRITILGYSVMILLEVLAMTGFYMMIQKVFLHDQRFWFEVYYTAILNTTLILLIPYLISLLYFAWLDKKRHVEQLLTERIAEPEQRLIHFRDENDEVRLSVNLENLLYLKASENYITIHYVDELNPDRVLIRNRMKRMEEQLAGLPVVRCHRSYILNLNKVKLIRKTREGLYAELAAPDPVKIPISEKYRDKVVQTFKP